MSRKRNPDQSPAPPTASGYLYLEEVRKSDFSPTGRRMEIPPEYGMLEALACAHATLRAMGMRPHQAPPPLSSLVVTGRTCWKFGPPHGSR
jgi:hypothetical protein